jgi:signal peptidase II
MRFSGKGRWVFLIAVALIGFFLDWLSKYMVVASLPLGRPVPVIGHYFQFLFVYNTGAIFGINPRALFPGFPVNLFFYIFNAIALVILVLYYRAIPSHKTMLQLGVALVTPGALGNLMDRIIYTNRGVVDFIRLGISENIYWFIFNFADVYITFGVALILLEFITEEFGKKRPIAAVAASGGSLPESAPNDKPAP